MPEYTIVAYTRCIADDDEQALDAALDVLVRSYDRVAIKKGSVVLRDYTRSSNAVRVNIGRPAALVRRQLAGEST